MKHESFTIIDGSKKYSETRQLNWGLIWALVFCLIFWGLVIWGAIEIF